ncbi:MAG: isopeptide-forming domain-containing fimbrial protein [Bacilli bacterium]|nr:isopeptide-forming domain-containing fimbrial protein [Bacilli bacterium]
MKKRILSLLVAIFTFGLVLNVDAASITTGSTKGTVDTNSYIVTNDAALMVTNAPASDTLAAYKILDTFYNASTNVITYEFTSNFKAFLASSSTYRNLTVDEYYNLTSGDITSGSTRTSSTLDRLASAYASYVKTNSVIGADLTYDEGEGATGTVLPAGAYLVLPKVTNSVYAVMVGNIIPTANGNDWTINDATIVAKVANASVVKSVGSIGHVDGTYDIGEEFSYFLVGGVPQYPTNATNKVYTMKDIIGPGLDFLAISSFVVKDGETSLLINSDGTVVNAAGNTVATITISGKNLTIAFNVDYVTSTTVTVEYKAKLNNSAVLGDTGNLNSATLTYSNDPYGTGTITSNVAQTSVFTYGVEVLIYANGDKSKVLSGVKFEVYSDASLTKKLGEMTTDSTGRGRLPGLAEGTYYLKQVSTASGYTLPKDAITIKVKLEGSTPGSVDGYYEAEVAAFEAGTLPFTGGPGTILYTVIGMITIVSAILLFVLYARKKKQEQAA